MSSPLLAGCDFSSTPTRRKPIVLALGREARGRVVLERIEKLETIEAFKPSKPLQMNGSIAAARRPQNARTGQPAHARRPHAAPPRHAHAGPKRHGSSTAGRGGQRSSSR